MTTNQEQKKQIRILFAEDDEICQMMTSRTLEKLGYSVTSVANGKEAFEKAGNGQFDFILMDVEMPVMDGITSTKMIRQHEQTHGGHVPILALTGYNVPGIREKMREAGMDAIVDKAVKSAELHAMIQSLLKESKPGEDTSGKDYARLEGLANAAGEKSVIMNVIHVFLEEVPGQIQDLKTAVEEESADKTIKAAHKIRGSAAALGADAFKTDALRLEMDAKEQPVAWDKVQDDLRNLHRSFDKLKQFLEKHK